MEAESEGAKPARQQVKVSLLVGQKHKCAYDLSSRLVPFVNYIHAYLVNGQTFL